MTPCVGWVPTLLAGHAFDLWVISMSNDSFNCLANWGEQWISEPLDKCPPSARMTMVLANPWDCASLHIQGLYEAVNFIAFLKWCTTIPNLFYYSPGLYFFFLSQNVKKQRGNEQTERKEWILQLLKDPPRKEKCVLKFGFLTLCY